MNVLVTVSIMWLFGALVAATLMGDVAVSRGGREVRSRLARGAIIVATCVAWPIAILLVMSGKARVEVDHEEDP